ncbi:DUF7847 domain-containing protein [Halostagnicola kamekurae]|uniref:DUF7847 domain-containing protein n=1 Tax=Halostagnicola kamekurae TaxID=619731 RepID=A0A1I6P7U9_9EURY|nr:hypothetical protein [Halostagnicola kamekurae]SFS36261.1 hypothetical protein SAMN04488556_0380 [Halostagnicola kamekurae]
MVIVSAFKDGYAALRANPILLVAGPFIGAGSQLQYVDSLIDSSLLSVGASLAYLIVVPFALGGFIASAQAAIEGKGTSLGRFVAAGRSYYVRLLLGIVLFVLVVGVSAIGFGFVSFILGIGSLVLVLIHEMAAVIAGVGSILVWPLLVLVVILFVQFYDAAIVVENENVVDSFRRSVHLVRSNLKSVTGFSLVWLVLLNAFLIPEYLLQLTLTDAEPADVLPVILEVPSSILVLVGALLSAIGFAYFYTVYTAYYLRLIEISPASLESA